MLYGAKVTICSQIHTKNINTVCVGREYSCGILNLFVQHVTIRL
jgi:hypothetical protein